MSKMDEVQKMLHQLSQKQLKQTRLLIDVMLHPAEDTQENRYYELYYTALSDNMYKNTKQRIQYFNAFKKTKGYKGFEEAVDRFNVWLQEVMGSITILQRRKLYILATKLVITDLNNANIVVCLRTCIHFMDNLPGYFDKVFPGYAKSGLLIKLIQNK